MRLNIYKIQQNDVQLCEEKNGISYAPVFIPHDLEEGRTCVSIFFSPVQHYIYIFFSHLLEVSGGVYYAAHYSQLWWGTVE